MNIQEATKKAMEIGGLIARPPWIGHVHIKPTNQLPECCVVYSKANGKTTPRWEPFAEDLMADDWEVTTEELI